MTSSTTELVYVLRDKAPELSTRGIGERLRGQLIALEDATPANVRIVIDVSGINLLTPSFVDEFFGRLVAERGLDQFKKRFTIRGADADWQSLINAVVRNRVWLDRQQQGPPLTQQ